MSSSKRSSSTDSSSSSSPKSSAPPKKRQRIVAEQPRLVVASQEELDIGVLRYQNRRLAERLQQRQRLESDLKARIEQLEKKQTNDEAITYVINRYWNQLNEDIRVLLLRFDAETSDETENKNENEETTSFLRQLSNWDKEEMDNNLKQRVQVSTRAVAKVLQAFDRIVQRNNKIMLALKGDESEGSPPDLNESVKKANIELTNENKSLNCLVTSLHEKQHKMGLEMGELKDKLEINEQQIDELKNRIDDIEFELNRTRIREQRLEDHLYEAREKLRDVQNTSTNAQNEESKHTLSGDGISHSKVEDLKRELEEQKDLAQNRLVELEQLNKEHKDTLKLVEKYKMDLQCLPESVILDTPEYKCLQSHFSVLFNESMQLKTQLEETRTQLTNAKNTHLRQIEHMESEELTMQKRLRTELMQLEDSLAQVRKEYEMLRLEFEQNLAANEQTGPINREMRHLITSLQNHNQQLKGENGRFKKKLKDATHEISKLKHNLESNLNKDDKSRDRDSSNVPSSADVKSELKPTTSDSVKDEPHIKEELDIIEIKKEKQSYHLGSHQQQQQHHSSHHKHHHGGQHPVKKELDSEQSFAESSERKSENDLYREIRDLKAQLKMSQQAQRELKLLLDMHKSVDKERREKAQLMACEKKAKIELEELRQQMKKMQESERRDRRKLVDEDILRKHSKYEDMIQQMQKNLAIQKQEEEAMLNEMEVTGQAFEDMQEQNLRLIQQLREKDDANFKLMSERIKSNQIHKLLKEEKEMLTEQVISLQAQVEAQNQVVRKLEEKERLLQNNLSTIEKELSLRQQSMELHKRKAVESTQSAADLKLHLEKYLAQVKEAQSTVAEKTSAWQQEFFKTQRLQEDVQFFKRKYERAKKFELATTADEVLQEEIRELKEELTCPSCKTKRKDAVLNKCFHVFCFDCLKTRYETRQRKCPKCNQTFGANDFHRLYLA
ncbi:E3 ubiquitin-protein ligase Bre1-like isoform X2 [Oppia nitens]|uniref:E3 ubiquitin-protein ligase Bre1-like isoform X2 n=1 Tax=Oppia nitens TaxID=1686743 RepID=UPI0023DA4D9A|nr:E3 ubiquitin-protein ligase Bre1-like isoform X2 [Oppia nitens]